MNGAVATAGRPRGGGAARTLGRFELRRQIGRGAQAVVWLAHDPLLQRDVALKVLDGGADAGAVAGVLDEWLHEARAVSALTHANIVPVFEAGADGGVPYLVFEYVAGPTLAARRRERPLWPAREAAQLVLDVLDALAAAHERGIVHRDLKPSNILLGADGRPRVMDFGIAARVAAGADGRIVGTPGYMSPEAARGEAPQPVMDVFAAGVLLGELLAGRPLLRETDPLRAVQRVQREDLALPADALVDDTLRGIVQRALARNPAERYDSARAMHAALDAWLQPAEAPAAPAGHGTLEFLLRRMRHKTDFPALSDAVVRIQRLATSETANVGHLADEIRRDVALTHKLLRMVNSAHFAAAGSGQITTVSRAVSLVGFAGIRNMALSVLLLEHMADKAHASHLKQEFLRALMTGALAAEMATIERAAEEAFLGSMFQNLGRLLTEYYFPEEALQIRQHVEQSVGGESAREAVAVRLLGMGLDDLGAGVARAWGLPESLQRAMRRPAGEPPAQPPAGVERMRWIGRTAAAMTDALLEHGAAEQDAAVREVARVHAPLLGVSGEQMLQATRHARTQLTTMAQAMGLHVARGATARRLLAAPPRAHHHPVDSAGAAAAPGGERTLVLPGRPEADASEPVGARATTVASAAAPVAKLQGGLDALRQARPDGGLRVNELLSFVLETLHAALELRAVVFCLRDPDSGIVGGRFAIGDVPAHAFRIDPAAVTSDLFAAVLAKGADTLIADAGTLAHRLPAWYRRSVHAGTFVLLPLVVGRAPVGLIYGDKGAPHSLTPGEAELELVRALRDEVVRAFSRGSGPAAAGG